MKHTLSQEAYLAEEFRLLGIKPHITHLIQPENCRYCAVTVVSPFYISYSDLEHDLSVVFSSAEENGIVGCLGRYIVECFSKNLVCCGVALCHHSDQFNRKRGRIIAEGRLLKLARRAKQCI